jgi:proteasome lid subunit RPN8/RPN11
MITFLRGLFGLKKNGIRVVETFSSPVIVMPQSCSLGIERCLAPYRDRKHEGVSFLLGRTDQQTVVCMLAVRPNARTTSGSFYVPAPEMAKVVGFATDLGLQIVAQVHTHPGRAYHSDGDEEGANIRYEGFVSIVVPNYGEALPDFANSVVYFFDSEKRWRELPLTSIRILPSEMIL